MVTLKIFYNNYAIIILLLIVFRRYNAFKKRHHLSMTGGRHIVFFQGTRIWRLGCVSGIYFVLIIFHPVLMVSLLHGKHTCISAISNSRYIYIYHTFCDISLKHAHRQMVHMATYTKSDQIKFNQNVHVLLLYFESFQLWG